MKKQIILSSLIVAALWSFTAVAVFNTANAKESNGDQGLLTNNSALTTTKTPLATKNETVYVMTDENGNVKSKFIGSTLYEGTEELPFGFSINYYLNGEEISAKDLAGKSGHVKIVYHYSAAARYQGRYVPFLALTNLVLDHAKFSNIKTENGKILHETPDNYIVTGFALAGGNTDLGVDFLPESFTFEADVTDFKLEDSYTVFTNDLIADIDLSKLTDLDSVVNSIYQLSDGLDKIIAGSNTLVDGSAAALDGTKKLYEGSKELSNGLNELQSHNEELLAGVDDVLAAMPTFVKLLQEKKAGLQAKLDLIPEDEEPTHIAARSQLLAGIAEINATLVKLSGMGEFKEKVTEYANGVATAAAGAGNLSEGLGALVEGQTKLYQGTVTLRDGLATFKTSGIDKLVKFATQDLSRFTNNLRATVRAAGSYKSFGNVDAKTVKFIVKTPSI